MAKVIANMTMSLDGFIADPEDGVDELFTWCFSGDTEIPTGRHRLRMSAASAELFRDVMENIGALVVGRRLFDMTDGWGGNHPMGVPTYVVTHSVPDGWPREDSSMIFVTDGLESAVAQAKETAGDKRVGVGSANVVQQALDAGLVNEIQVDLAPVILGAGIPFFAGVKNVVALEDPTVVEGQNVTHLRYRVKR